MLPVQQITLLLMLQLLMLQLQLPTLQLLSCCCLYDWRYYIADTFITADTISTAAVNAEVIVTTIVIV